MSDREFVASAAADRRAWRQRLGFLVASVQLCIDGVAVGALFALPVGPDYVLVFLPILIGGNGAAMTWHRWMLKRAERRHRILDLLALDGRLIP